MDLQLTGKVAFVTGGSKGIGRAVAQELAQEGCDVVITARTQEPLEVAAREIAAMTNRKIVPLDGDMSKHADVQRCVGAALYGMSEFSSESQELPRGSPICGGARCQSLGVSLVISGLDDEVSALHIAKVSQTLTESPIACRVAVTEDAYLVYLADGLCLDGERRDEKRARGKNKLPAANPHGPPFANSLRAPSVPTSLHRSLPCPGRTPAAP